MEEVVVLALPLLVVHPTLQLGNGWVKEGRMVILVLCLLFPFVLNGGNAR
jgi:hypothetical protein